MTTIVLMSKYINVQYYTGMSEADSFDDTELYALLETEAMSGGDIPTTPINEAMEWLKLASARTFARTGHASYRTVSELRVALKGMGEDLREGLAKTGLLPDGTPLVIKGLGTVGIVGFYEPPVGPSEDSAGDNPKDNSMEEIFAAHLAVHEAVQLRGNYGGIAVIAPNLTVEVEVKDDEETFLEPFTPDGLKAYIALIKLVKHEIGELDSQYPDSYALLDIHDEALVPERVLDSSAERT